MSTALEDVSITATEATVAGSSVAVTEAEEDAASLSQPSATEGEGNNASKEIKVILTKEPSLKDIAISNLEDDDDDGEDSEEEYAAPMHLHALRTPARLKGVRSRSSSRSRPGSRRNSISPPRGGKSGSSSRNPVGVGELIVGAGISLSPAVSVGSSLDGVPDHHSWSGDVVDPDILLDKLGFRDLDANATQEEMQEMLRKHVSSQSGMPTLNERMCEETMDDVHAFRDLSFVKKTSHASSTNSSIDELDEDGSPEKSQAGNNRRATMERNKGMSNSAIMGSTTYLLNTLNEEDESSDEEEGADVILEIPEGVMSPGGERSRKNRGTLGCTTMAVVHDNGENEDEDGVVLELPPGLVSAPKRKNRDTTMAIAGSFDESDDDIDEDGGGDAVVSGVPSPDAKGRHQKRDTMCSMNPLISGSPASSIADSDEENLEEVDVPTTVMEELQISEGKRTLEHEESSMAVEGKAFDYMEGNEQEGLEDDLSDEVR